MRSFLLVAILATSAAADSKKPTTDHYTIRVRTTDAAGKVTFVPVGEVTRTKTGITAKGLPAPALDKLTDQFAKEWAAWKPPAKIAITERIYSDTGMHPSLDPHTVEFTAKDKLYQAASLRMFAEQHHYSVLGLSTVKFVEYDSTAESPAGAHDRSSRHYNFRKGTELDFGGGYESFFVSVTVAKPTSDNRVSASDPKLTINRHNDEGTLQVAWLKLHENGTWDVELLPAGKNFENAFGSFVARDTDVNVIIDGSDYKQLHVAKTSPLQLEAQLVENIEERDLYDIEPAIDPALFR